ncbi:MAG: hypothetical protein IPL61_11165 [Myxococcales bacterium]|nr:hypothetical protein [Myxococcales bacterium]
MMQARLVVIASLGLATACGGRRAEPARGALDAGMTASADAALAADAFVPRHTVHPDVAAAMQVVLADRPRVLGIGEIHERTDRAAAATPALARFASELLPAIARQTSDLVIETWTLAPGCKTGVDNSRRIEQSMRRPAATTGQISSLFGITKANSITAHVMRLTCDDLAAAVTPDGVDPERLLGLVTRELGRVAASAVRYRDEHQETRPMVVVYGGALHNDLYPPRSTREWSYALAVDTQTGGRYVELDLYRPEQVEDVDLYMGEPWYPLVAKTGPDRVVLIERAPHAYLLLLPREP